MICSVSAQTRPEPPVAGVAELADARDLKSRGSNPVPVRPRSPAPYRGIEQLVARRAHNPEVGGSSPPPATIKSPLSSWKAVISFAFRNFFRHSPFRGHQVDPDSDPYGAKPRPGRGVSVSGLSGIFVVFRVSVRGLFPSPWPPLSGRRWSHGHRCPG